MHSFPAVSPPTIFILPNLSTLFFPFKECTLEHLYKLSMHPLHLTRKVSLFPSNPSEDPEKITTTQLRRLWNSRCDSGSRDTWKLGACGQCRFPWHFPVKRCFCVISARAEVSSLTAELGLCRRRGNWQTGTRKQHVLGSGSEPSISEELRGTGSPRGFRAGG